MIYIAKPQMGPEEKQAVLEVLDRMVLIADPVLGRQLMSHKDFERAWRFSGIVLERDKAQNI